MILPKKHSAHDAVKMAELPLESKMKISLNIVFK